MAAIRRPDPAPLGLLRDRSTSVNPANLPPMDTTCLSIGGELQPTLCEAISGASTSPSSTPRVDLWRSSSTSTPTPKWRRLR